MRRSTLGHALLLASAGLRPQGLPESVTPRQGPITLPAGKVAELLERLDPSVKKEPLGPAWPEWRDRSAAGWGGEFPWRRWVELVRAESAARTPDAARRAELAVLARLQGRDGDAWEHLLACASHPGLVAALFPLFLPGVPQSCLGQEGALADGVVLSPALPPCDDPRATLRWLAGRQLEHSAVSVGTARCALKVSVEGDGIEVSLRHLGGGAARIALVPPLPRGIDPGLLFADWEKRPGEAGPVEFRLDAEASEHTLWLTFHPPEARWPDPRPEQLTGIGPDRRILLLSPRGDEPHLARFAEALGELLGVRAALRSEELLRSEDLRSEPGLEPLALHLGAGPGAERKLVQLIGLVEAFLLARSDR